MKTQNIQNGNALFPSSLRGAFTTRQSFPTNRLLRFARNDRPTENGNALWFILIAIILLGLLTAMMTRSGGNTNDTGDYERLSIKANEIINFGRSLGNGIQMLLSRGCSENEISFEDPLLATQGDYSDHSNPNSPPDFSCHIFRPEGAGLTYWITSDIGIYDTSGPVTEFYINASGWWHPDSPNAPVTDWAMILSNLTKEACMAINNALGVTNPSGDAPDATAESVGGTNFRGNFSTGHAFNREVRSAGGELENEFSACFKAGLTSPYPYVYYQTLHFR